MDMITEAAETIRSKIKTSFLNIVSDAVIDYGSNYSDNESKILNKTLEYRAMMIDELFQNGQPPSDVSKMRIANELLSKMDEQVQTAVDQRIKSNQEGESDYRDLAIELIKSLNREHEIKRIDQPEVKELPEEIAADIDIPETALIDGKEILDVNDFVIDVKKIDEGDKDDI